MKEYTESERFGCYEKFEAIRISDNKKVRCMNEEGTVFVYMKGGRRYGYGYRYPRQQFDMLYKAIAPADKTAVWHKRINRAIECLEKSGLWEEDLKIFKNLLLMTYEDYRAMTGVYWERFGSTKVEEFSEQYKPYYERYPFAFEILPNGNLQLKYEYIQESNECRLKSMYFGKGENAFVKERIASAIKKKQPFSYHTRTSYDVRFEYDPEKNKAWYSEEYKDCGNGHYYIALDQSTALFCEDD